MKFINLIRYKNIIILAATQLLIHFSVIAPTIQSYSITGILSTANIFLIVISSCLIAAGGYVINDYFDIKIDRINKPNKMIITNGIEKKTAMRFYQILTAIGIIIGLIPAFATSSITLGFIVVVTPGMLWFYSASYKRQLIIGNIIVATATALAVLLPLIAQNAVLYDIYGDLIYQTPIPIHLYTLVCGFALFAFAFTIIREIIKDLQDEIGDREMECHTIPIVWSTTTAKIIISAITTIVLASLLILSHKYLNFGMDNNISLRYFSFAVAAPSITMLAMLWSKSCSAYKNASNMVKFTIILGLLYAILYQFIIAKLHGIPFLGIFNII